MVNKAAIYALGGISIGNAMVMLNKSVGTRVFNIDNSETTAKVNNLKIHFMKRIGNIFTSATVFIISTPFLVIISILVFASSMRNVFLNRVRNSTRGSSTFEFKLRDNISKAEESDYKSRPIDIINDPVFKMAVEPLITKSGRILHRTYTRAEQYERWQLMVKPEKICTWQILPDENELNLDHWIKKEIQYYHKRSPKNDAVLFLQTFKSVLLIKGY
jgi:lipopolysaccharide/colanic/teichoic acid biosynthesis glycosyltransferase